MISTFDRLRAILVKDYQLAPSALTMDVDLESLGIDSLGVAELLFSIEDEFRVTLPPEPAELNTVGDVVRYIDALVAGRVPATLKPRAVGHAGFGVSVTAHPEPVLNRSAHADVRLPTQRAQ